MRRPLRLACLAAAVSGLCIPQVAAACLPPEPLPPPPRTPAESEPEFAARSEKWYSDLFEGERTASLPGRMAEEDGLWAKAERVVLARVAKVGSIRLRGSERQLYKSPLATLRAVRWLKGHPSPRRLKVHFLSDDTCDHGAGNAPYGQMGEVFLLFYRAGRIEPRNVLDTFRKDRVVTARSRAAFDVAGAAAALPAETRLGAARRRAARESAR